MAYATGIRRILSKNGGHLELFNLSEISLARSRSGLDKIATAETIESFKNLRQDLKKTAIAYFFAEIVDKLTAEKDKNPSVFNLLLETLLFLDKNKSEDKFDILSSYFIFNLLDKIGYR